MPQRAASGLSAVQRVRLRSFALRADRATRSLSAAESDQGTAGRRTGWRAAVGRVAVSHPAAGVGGKGAQPPWDGPPGPAAPGAAESGGCPGSLGWR